MSEENKTVASEEEVKSDPLKKLPDLKTLREVSGLTTEEIFLKTRINATILNAIENGEFHLLPSPVFTKKFIRIYAETIGIDAGIILAHYQRHLDEREVVPEEVNLFKAQISFDRKPFPRYLLYALPAVAIIVTACIMYAFFHQKGTFGIFQHSVTVDEQKEVVSKPAPAVKEPPPEAATNVPQAPPPVMGVQKETTQTQNNAHLNLLIEATEKTWLNITEDQNPPYQITLKRGDKLSRNAREFFVIDVGNAAGVN
ncbi:MAG: helix-turn-helix domain-containing protein, partial [Desulfuromonadaceae bacterium]|nr:helix-turn-helix domain-containing protein [Desulfuromonadaceae bacterium]